MRLLFAAVSRCVVAGPVYCQRGGAPYYEDTNNIPVSMGVGQSMSIGLHHLDQFAYIAAFSGGGNRADWENADSAMLNQKLKVLWIGCGTEEPGYNGVNAMEDLLTRKNVKQSGGRHSWLNWLNWLNWQVYLSEYAPLLFRD